MATLRVIDAMTTVPAYVRNGRFDILAANELGRARYSPLFESPLFAERGPVNSAGFCFLHPAAHEFWVDWDKAADDSVAFIWSEVGRSAHDRLLTQLVGELSTRSQAFATRWARHDVKFHRAGLKHLRHPLVGELDLPYEGMDLSADSGIRLNVYYTGAALPGGRGLGIARELDDSRSVLVPGRVTSRGRARS